MKVGRMLIVITVALLGCYGLAVHAIGSMERTRIPVEQMNDILKQLEENKVTNQQMVQEFQRQIQTTVRYEVVFCTDSSYEKVLYEAYRNQSILMDVKQDDQIIGKLVVPMETKEKRNYVIKCVFIVVLP